MCSEHCRVHEDRESIGTITISDSETDEELIEASLCEECVLDFVESAGVPDSIKCVIGESQD